MPQQVINIGSYPSDGSGDPLRVSFDKINQNFAELYAGNTSPVSGSSVTSVNGKSGPNVILGVTDIHGAASVTYVNAQLDILRAQITELQTIIANLTTPNP